MAKIYDVSMTIREGMAVYKSNPAKQPSFEMTSSHEQNQVQETRAHLDVHTGTHIDAPLHMVEHGATIESIGLEKLVRFCRVIDLTSVVGAITAEDLRPHQPKLGEFLLLKTKNSWDETWNADFIFVGEEAAQLLATSGIAGVGVDGLGVERSQAGHPTHKHLFAAGAIVIEGLRLADVPEGIYWMVALPLKLEGLDAAPARIILVDPQSVTPGAGAEYH